MLSISSSPGMIGLDIRGNSIRLIHLKKKKRHFFVQQLAVRELPDTGLQHNKIMAWDMVTSQIAELVAEHRLQGLPTTIGLPANLVRMRRVRLPSALTAIDMEREILSKHIHDRSLKSAALHIDFSLLSSSKQGYADMVYAATCRDYLQQYTQAIKSAGLRVKVVDVDIYALIRAVCYALSFTQAFNEQSAIVHIVGEQVLFVCFDDEHILFYQQWHIEANNLRYSQLQTSIQFSLAAHENMQLAKIIFCCDEQDYLTMQPLLNSFAATWHYCPLHFESMMLDVHVDEELIKNPHLDWWHALGLAMRETHA